VEQYPTDTGVVYMVFTDKVALSLATADPEDSNISYKTDAEVPIIWHLTNTTIRNQGRWIEQVVLETCVNNKPDKIRIVWIPLNKTNLETLHGSEVIEVADVMLKLKILGRKNGVSVRAGLAKSWMPKDLSNQQKALQIHRMNLALEVLSFYWFQCRCLDLSQLTMDPKKPWVEITDENRMDIPGYDDMIFQPRSYRNLKSDPMAISYFAARRGREEIRLVLLKGVEPNWTRALQTKVEVDRVKVPQITRGQDTSRLIPPARGGEACHQAILDRVREYCRFESGMTNNRTLSSTGLEEYPWDALHLQSENPEVRKTGYKTRPISRGNMILLKELPDNRERRVVERGDCVNVTVTAPSSQKSAPPKKPMSERLEPRKSEKGMEPMSKKPEPETDENKMELGSEHGDVIEMIDDIIKEREGSRFNSLSPNRSNKTERSESRETEGTWTWSYRTHTMVRVPKFPTTDSPVDSPVKTQSSSVPTEENKKKKREDTTTSDETTSEPSKDESTLEDSDGDSDNDTTELKKMVVVLLETIQRKEKAKKEKMAKKAKAKKQKKEDQQDLNKGGKEKNSGIKEKEKKE